MLVSLVSGIGGAASAGLNAYLPLLIIALSDRSSSSFNLDSPYDAVSSQWGIVVLLLLLPIELVADKIPRLDQASDLIHSVIRPAAAGFIAMALSDERGDLSPIVAGILGVVVGFAVHRYKATTRPAITRATSGVANPLISMIEDVVATIAIIVSIFYPPALFAVLPIAAYALYRAYARMKKGSRRLRRLAGSPS